jgi:hypothetical protein
VMGRGGARPGGASIVSQVKINLQFGSYSI